MKHHYITLGLLLLSLGSCSKYSYDEPQPTFSVVKTEFSSTYKGSEGYFDLSEEGIVPSVDVDWITLHQEGKRIKFTIKRNEDIETRVGSIILTKGNEVQRVPITQLGVVNDAKLSNYTFDRDEGDKVFTTHFESTPTVTIPEEAQSWLSYKIEEGQLILQAQKMSFGADRSAEVIVKAEAFEQSITLSQRYGNPKVSDLLGSYTLRYKTQYGEPEQQITAILQSSASGGLELVSDQLPIALIFEYQEESGRLGTPTGIYNNNYQDTGKALVVAAWGAGSPNPDGSRNFNWVYDS